MTGEIFISYRRADAAWARLLHERLHAEGVEAWYDAQVGAGQDWRIATAKALEDSRIFVLLFSENAAQSSDIAKELAAAVLEKKLIIPVRLENIAPKGAFLYELASRNWVNAFDDTGPKLAELAMGLARMVRSGTGDESLLPFERAATAPAARWIVDSCRPFFATDALEGQPSFSSDGKMLAYTSGADFQSRNIYVRNVARGDGIRITADPDDNVSPSWSLDSTRIAYIARKKGEPCRILVASVPAGEVREVGRCIHAESSTVSWQPGTSFLYYIDRTGLVGNTLFRLDLDTGTHLKLPKAAGKEGPTGSSFQMIVHLQCSPDGKSLLYLWGVTASALAIVIRDLTGGTEKTVGQIIGGGSAAWSEDSRAVLAATASGIGSIITAYPLDGGAPHRVYAASTRITHLAAGAGGLLALEADTSRENLARATPQPAAQPDIIDPARGRSWAPTFAPDGTLAFLSNRSSTNAIWTMKPGTASAMLYDAGLLPMFRVEYSPDGTRLAAAIAHENGITIRIVASSGAVVGSFDSPTLGFGHPSWTPDGKSVILFDRTRLQEVCVSLDDPVQRLPVAEPPLHSIKISDKGVFCARIDKPGIWQIGNEARLISGKYPIHFGPPITFRGEDVLIPEFNAPNGARILAQPLAGGQDRVVGYAPGAFASPEGQSKMAVNPKTGEIVYVAAVQGDTGIDLLTLSRQ
jgi:hypothetical protein